MSALAAHRVWHALTRLATHQARLVPPPRTLSLRLPGKRKGQGKGGSRPRDGSSQRGRSRKSGTSHCGRCGSRPWDGLSQCRRARKSETFLCGSCGSRLGDGIKCGRARKSKYSQCGNCCSRPGDGISHFGRRGYRPARAGVAIAADTAPGPRMGPANVAEAAPGPGMGRAIEA